MGDALNPHLWVDLGSAYCHFLGNGGDRLFDHGPFKNHGDFDGTNLTAADWGVNEGIWTLNYDDVDNTTVSLDQSINWGTEYAFVICLFLDSDVDANLWAGPSAPANYVAYLTGWTTANLFYHRAANNFCNVQPAVTVSAGDFSMLGISRQYNPSTTNGDVSFFQNGAQISTPQNLGDNTDLTLNRLGGFGSGIQTGNYKAVVAYGWRKPKPAEHFAELWADPFAPMRRKRSQFTFGWTPPIRIIQISELSPGAGTGDHDTSFASNVTTGSTVIVAVGHETTNSLLGLTDTQGNTYREIRTLSSTRVITLWYAHNVKGGFTDVTFDWNTTGGGRHICMMEYNADLIYGQSAAAQTTGQTSHSGGSLTPIYDNGLSVHATRAETANESTPGENFTRVADTGNRLLVFERVVLASQSVDPTFTTVASENMTNMHATFYQPTVTSPKVRRAPNRWIKR